MAAKKNIDWIKAEQEYLNVKNATLADISRKYGCSYVRVKQVAKKYQWIIKKEKMWLNAEKEAIEESEGSVKDLIKRHARMARYLQAIGIKELQVRIKEGELSRENMEFLLKLIDRGMVLEATLYPKTLQITGEVGLTAETIPEELKEAIYEIYRKKTTGRKRPSIHRKRSPKGARFQK